MGTVKEFLEDSELGKFENVFPVLTVPTLGSDADGYLRTLAACAIEQVKFLNSYAEIPVATLYENVGQRNKANNLAVLSFLRKTGNTGEGLGLITIPGEQVGSYSANNETDCPEALWATQTEVVKRQSDFLTTISGTYAEKLAALPQQPSWWGVLFDSAVEYAVGWLGDTLVGAVVGTAANAAEATQKLNVIRQLVAFSTEFAFNAWDYVKTYYNDTGLICMQMKAENDALCALPRSRENYALRAQTLIQHDATMKNLIELIDALEKDAQKALPQESLTALVQAVQDLRFNGTSLQFPNGHVVTMVGPTITQETVLT